MVRELTEIFTVILLWVTGVSLSNNVRQTPPALLLHSGDSEQLNCSHNINSYDTILWYQQPERESALKLIGYIPYKKESIEPSYEGHFNISGDGQSTASLHIPKVNSADSAVYFCAASRNLYSEAIFGTGTKLTVLEPGIEITPPNVKVLPPSGQELCKTKSVTLVCVATRFYPDHINVIWQLNGKDAKNYVTDNRALWDDNNKTYSITSRLKVLSKQWFNTKNKFTCLTSFYNGEKNLENQDTIQGVEGGGMNIEYIKKSGLTAKLSYGVLLFKSFGYGLFVFAVVWKLRGSAKKRNN